MPFTLWDLVYEVYFHAALQRASSEYQAWQSFPDRFHMSSLEIGNRLSWPTGGDLTRRDDPGPCSVLLRGHSEALGI